ncbi:MAG: spore coat U domain-containing protein, partial [Nitrospiria bacterium]
STGIIFSNYDVFSPLALNSTGTVSVTCPGPGRTRVTITIGPSPNSGGFIPRQMKHSILPDFLSYNLYTNAAGTRVWGDGTSGTRVVRRRVRASRRRPRPRIVTVFGIVPPMQNVAAGSYSDILTVTVTP